MSITFERATEADAAQLMDVQNRAFYPDLLKYGECPGYLENVEEMLDRISRDFFYKILDGPRIVGGLKVKKRSETHYHLTMLCVDPECHNMGIGTKALEYIERTFPDARFWTLITPKDNLRNVHFYEKMGFKNAAERKHSDRLTLIRFEKGEPPADYAPGEYR